MPTAEIIAWSGQKLEPYYAPERALEIAVKLPVSVNYPKGTVLGEKIGTNEVQKITITGGPTGGTFTVTYAAITSGAIAYNAPAIDVQTALEAMSSIGDGNVRVTGGPGPGTPWTIEFRGVLGRANLAAVTTTDSFSGGSSPATAVTTVTNGATGTAGTWTAYDNDNTDGSGIAKAILAFDVQTDASGNHTLSSTSGQAGGEYGQTSTSVPAYIHGWFRTNDLTGLDEVAIGQLGRLVHGTVADGVIHVY